MLKRTLSAGCLLFALSLGLTACDSGGSNGEEEPDDDGDGQEQADAIPTPPSRPGS